MSDVLVALGFIVVVFIVKIWFTLRIINEAQSRKTDDDN